MQTQVTQLNQGSLPTTQTQMPANQNENAENIITKHRKNTVQGIGVWNRYLGKTTYCISFQTFLLRLDENNVILYKNQQTTFLLSII